jgi:ferrous iron transport protein B
MMTYPGLPDAEQQNYTEQRQEVMAAYPEIMDEEGGDETKRQVGAIDERAALLAAIDREESAAALRHSVAGRIGLALESLSRLAGFDWRTNIALIGGFAAKEVIVSTLGTAYSMGDVDAEESASLSKRLQRSDDWNRVVAVAALVFIMFYAPCFVTVACIAKESSWRWAAFSMTFNTVFAFGLAVLVYQVGTILGLG